MTASGRTHPHMLAESTILTGIYFGRSEALIWAFAELEWGGWGSNPRPADYESGQPANCFIASELGKSSLAQSCSP